LKQVEYIAIAWAVHLEMKHHNATGLVVVHSQGERMRKSEGCDVGAERVLGNVSVHHINCEDDLM